MSVIGSDSRQITNAFGTFPLSAVTAIDIQTAASNFVGSGIVVGPNHILSAGHNDYDTGTNTFATALRGTISANQNALNSRNIGTAGDPAANITNTNFLKNYDTTEAISDDIALFTTNNALLPANNTIGLLAFVDPDSADGFTIDTAGYPGDNLSIPGNSGNFARDLVISPGATLSPGEVVDTTDAGRFFYSADVDTAGGQSGSGVWHTLDGDSTPRVLGVHAYGTGADDRLISIFGNRNSGTLITQNVYNDILAQIEADSGTGDADTLPENAIIGSDANIFSRFTNTGDDTIIGSYRKERILGEGGDDKIFGGGADDRLEGGDGIDQALFSGLFSEYDFTITDPANPAFEFDHVRGDQADGKDSTKDIEFGVFEFVDSDGDETDDDGDLFFVPLQVDPDDDTKLKDGPAITPEKDILNDDGDKIGTLTVESPAWMFDGDVDYTLTIGSEQSILYNFAYIIDTSGSMFGTPLAQAQNAYEELTQSLIDSGVASSSQFGIVPFNSFASLTGPVDASTAISTINSLSAGGGTSFGPALTQAENFFAGQNNNATNIAYFLSDGMGSGASASLQSVAEVRAFGIGSADLSTLNIIDSDSAVLLSDPADLVTEFNASRVDRDTIERIDVKVGGTVVDTIAPGQLSEDTLGLTFEGSLEDLEVTREAEDEIVFDLVFNDGTPTTSLEYKITTGQEQVRDQTDDGGKVVIIFSVNQSDFTGTGESEEVVGNSLNNVIDGGGGDNTLLGNGGDDTFILSGGANLVDGGEGIDTVKINKTQQAAGGVTKNGDVVNIGTDNSLVNVEYIEFSDVRLSLDTLAVVPIISLAEQAISLTEGDNGTSVATFQVTLSSATAENVVIDFATRSTTATAGEDYKAAAGQLVIAAGDTSGTVEVEILGDRLVEGNEAVFLDLSATSGATFAAGATTATAGVEIVDDDTVITVPITGDDPTVIEGSPGARSTLSLTLNRFGGLTGRDTVTVEVVAGGDNPAQADDFVNGFSSQQVTFAPDEATKTVNIAIAPDQTIEPDETFGIRLTSTSGNAAVPEDDIIYTILDDDGDGPGVSPVDANDDSYTTPEDTAFTTGNVLANDRGRGLSISALNKANTIGLITNNGDGTFSYDPNGQFDNLKRGERATDTFSYTVANSNGDTDTATVNITIRGVSDDMPPTPGTPINSIEGTEGDDNLVGTNGRDRLDALGGNDNVKGLNSKDILLGGNGSDRILGGTGADRLIGEEGNDVLLGEAGLDVLDGGEGDDRLLGGSGSDRILGRAGNDLLNGGDGRDTLLGGDDNDRLGGGNGTDRLLGEDGDDVLLGQTGNDLLDGGEGDDRLLGGDGQDRLLGKAGNDSLTGGEGRDWLLGGEGDDRLVGEAGNDRLIGDAGDDQLIGGLGNDYAQGGTGQDRLVGDAGNDRLDGGEDSDQLFGGAGRDRLLGGGGDDFIDGGAGNDFLKGGAGKDTFILKAGEGSDRIQDFTAGTDVIALAGSLTFGSLTLKAGNNSVLIEAEGELLAKVSGVSALTEDNFVRF